MYDEIASLYHLVYPDWDASIRQQSKAYYKAASQALGKAPSRILDVSCGIGTQSLGLAEFGCAVVASDLSAGAIERAKKEASARHLDIDFSVADMTQCYATHGGDFDTVICADNSLPHLVGQSSVELAVTSMYQCLAPGGVVLIGVRDYGQQEARGKGQVFSYGTREFEGYRYVVFQTRDWEDDSYEVGMYFVRELDESPAKVVCGKSRYYAITPDALMLILEAAGFEQVSRSDSATHNLLISGVRPI